MSLISIRSGLKKDERRRKIISGWSESLVNGPLSGCLRNLIVYFTCDLIVLFFICYFEFAHLMLQTQKIVCCEIEIEIRNTNSRNSRR